MSVEQEGKLGKRKGGVRLGEGLKVVGKLAGVEAVVRGLYRRVRGI